MIGPSRVLARRPRAHAAAVRAATETLLNCYMREYGGWHVVPAGEVPGLTQPGDTHLAVLAIAERQSTLLVGVRYLSPTSRHRFRLPVRLAVDGGAPSVASLATIAELLVRPLGASAGAPGPDPAALLARIGASVDAVGTFLAAREDEIDALWSARPLSFLDSEQALLLGHMLHPTPKSRSEMSDDELRAFSPETAARFRLHWLAVEPGLVEHDSATGTPAPRLAASLLRDDPAVDQAALDSALAGLGERVLIPAHPWELAHLREHDAVVGALLAGAIVDLGPLGSPVGATTSVRTVCHPDWPWQLKFSLHVRVTNSQRVTLPKELRRAVEAARLLQTAVGERASATAPDFVMLQDPAYLAVRHGGELIDGLSVLLREHRWRGDDRSANVSAVTTLCQDHPYDGRSRLGAIVGAIALREGAAETDVARAWFGRYCDVVLVSLLRLFLDLGLCMEPHAQNVLLELDDGGWPVCAVYRDSQGYFHRAAAHADMTAIAPGIGEASESIFPEALADERLVYYPFVNNALGVINALGVAGVADEHALLGDLRALLERERVRARGGRYPATLLDRLLDDAAWPCKANLRTRLHDLDELTGDIASQSVYVRIANPLRPATR